jgi:FemAB-related protein (PEP-CTERM system-associated)
VETRESSAPAVSSGSEPPSRLADAEPVRIEEVSLDDPRWDPFVLGHPSGTVCHRAGWQRAAARTFGYEPHLLLATRGNRTTGLLPLFRVPGFPSGSSLISTPLGVYAGVIAEDAESGAALFEHATALGERLGVGYLELRDGLRFEGLPIKDLYVTFRGTLGPNHEENLADIPRKKRRSVRVGMKQGLTIRVGRLDRLDAFYRVYSPSVRNLGTPVFPKALFRNLLEEFQGDEAEILVVEREGRPVAACFTFFDRGQALPYYAGALRETFQYSGSDFMYWMLMRLAVDRGCRFFDFGRSKRGTGAYDYKCHWGFPPTPLAYQYRLIRNREIPDLSPKNPRFSLAIRMWQRMPLPLAERLGPLLVRYFP